MGTATLASVLACLDATADALQDDRQQLAAALETWHQIRRVLVRVDPSLAPSLDTTDKALRTLLGTRLAALREQEVTVRVAARLVKRTDPTTLP